MVQIKNYVIVIYHDLGQYNVRDLTWQNRTQNTDLLQENCHENPDILSYTIIYQLWHIADIIFKNLDALSLLSCEKVIKRGISDSNEETVYVC